MVFKTRKQLAVMFLIFAITGFLLETVFGYLFHQVFGRPLLVYPGSPLFYSSWEGLPSWGAIGIVFCFMYVKIAPHFE